MLISLLLLFILCTIIITVLLLLITSVLCAIFNTIVKDDNVFEAKQAFPSSISVYVCQKITPL